jgi:hypothetical protein
MASKGWLDPRNTSCAGSASAVEAGGIKSGRKLIPERIRLTSTALAD